MFHVQGSIIIHRSVEEVFALLPYAVAGDMQDTSPSVYHDYWTVALSRSQPHGKIQVGSTFRSELVGSSAHTIVTVRVVELELNRKLTIEQSSVGTAALDGIMSYELEPVPEGTRLTMIGDVNPQGCNLFQLYSIPWIKQYGTSRGLRSFKRKLEQGSLSASSAGAPLSTSLAARYRPKSWLLRKKRSFGRISPFFCSW